MEEEVKQDVVADSSPAIESSNDGQETAQPETKEVVETPKVETAPPVREQSVEPVDEMGVPLKNRLAEAQRKLQQREKELEEYRSRPVQQQPEQRYTKEQLEAFAISAEDPNHRAWALKEINKISQEETKNIVRDEFKTFTQQQQEASVRHQTLNNLTQRHPDVISKDASGNLGFNMKSPLGARMQFYMQDERIASNPEALTIAEKFAKADLFEAQQPVVQKTIASQANQIKSIQKKTMVEGGGSHSNVSVSPRQAALEKLKQTGSIKDASVLMGEILKRQGTLSEE